MRFWARALEEIVGFILLITLVPWATAVLMNSGGEGGHRGYAEMIRFGRLSVASAFLLYPLLIGRILHLQKFWQRLFLFFLFYSFIFGILLTFS